MTVYEGLTETQQFACRVIADHARATAFAIADGILPGNEGRNYVLRKIMRRAIYHGREHLGLTGAFFYKVCDFVIEQMREAYPELETQREFIGKMVRIEEERFGNTLIVGLEKLDSDEIKQAVSIIKRSGDLAQLESNYAQLCQYMEENAVRKFEAKPEESGEIVWQALSVNDQMVKVPPAEALDFLSGYNELAPIGNAYQERSAELVTKALRDAQVDRLSERLEPFARLYDTYGIPRDLIRLKLEEQELTFSEDFFADAFDKAVELIQKQSGIGHTERKSQASPIYAEVLQKVGKNNFRGYDTTRES